MIFCPIWRKTFWTQGAISSQNCSRVELIMFLLDLRLKNGFSQFFYLILSSVYNLWTKLLKICNKYKFEDF